MTLRPEAGMTAPADPPTPARDHRGSPLPTRAMIATRFMELRRRRGLMITLILVTIGIPTVFLGARLLLHALAPKTYGPLADTTSTPGYRLESSIPSASSSPRP
jgi:hypothetical protein